MDATTLIVAVVLVALMVVPVIIMSRSGKDDNK